MPKRILIVNDDQRTRALVQDVLAQAGFEVCAPVDGYVGLDFALSRSFDLVVVEDQMALLDGQGFVESLRESNTSTPVLVLTSTDDSARERSLREADANEVIQKPFQVEHLLNCINQLLTDADNDVCLSSSDS